MNPPKSVTCSRPVPSVLIRYSSNFRPSQSCLFEANRIFLPSGVNVGAKLAQPKFVICFAILSLAVGHKQLHLHRRSQVFAQQIRDIVSRSSGVIG